MRFSFVNNKKNNVKVLAKDLLLVNSQLLPLHNALDFNHVCNIIFGNKQKSILKCKDTHNKKLSSLIPGYELKLK